MKIQLFFIDYYNKNSSGLSTYVKQLTDCFSDKSEIHLSYINTNSKFNTDVERLVEDIVHYQYSKELQISETNLNRYITTNPDLVCTSDEEVVLVDYGAIALCFEAATGRRPEKVLDKPQAEILTGLIASKNMEVNQVAMVDDRIYTDMLTANNAGSLGVLVLSGEADLDDVNESPISLDLILPSIKELGQSMLKVHGAK